MHGLVEFGFQVLQDGWCVVVEAFVSLGGGHDAEFPFAEEF